MFLQPLADKFVRLVLQLLARYCCWLAETVASRSNTGAATPSPDGSVSQVGVVVKVFFSGQVMLPLPKGDCCHPVCHPVCAGARQVTALKYSTMICNLLLMS